MIAASGCRSAARSSASSAVLGRDRLESGVAQNDPKRPQDLLLVIYDKDLGVGATGAHVGSAGSARGLWLHRQLDREGDDEARPLAGERLDRDRPSVGFHEPLRDRKPEAGPGPRVAAPGPSVERLEDAVTLRGADAGSLVDHTDRHPRSVPADVHRHGQAARVAHGVLEQVGERSLQVCGIGPDGRDVGIDHQAHVASGL